MFNKFFIKCLLIIPLFLLLINIYNFYFPNDYRNDLYLSNSYFSEKNKKILDFHSEGNRSEILQYKDAIKKFDELYSIHGESFKFLNEASKVYFISKLPSENSWQKKYSKIKFQENWVLYFFRLFEEIQFKNGEKSKYNGAYLFYHSSDYRFALKRGISLCSQDAISFANLIKSRYNINYNIIGLSGHVLMQAKIKNKYYLSDPNMGLTFDFDIEEYYNNELNQLKIKKAYTKIGRTDLINYFDKKGNRIFQYTGPRSKDSTFNPDTITFYSNYIKWLLPILFLLIGLRLNYKSLKVYFLKNFL